MTINKKALAKINKVTKKKPVRRTPKKTKVMESKTQQRMFASDAPHVIVEARAGSGKTFTLLMGIKKIMGDLTCWDCGGSGEYISYTCSTCNGTGNMNHIEGSPQQEAVWEEMAASPVRKACFCAFNRSIAKELKRKVPSNCEAKTMHGLGFRLCAREFDLLPDQEVNKFRTRDLLAKVSDISVKDWRENDLIILHAVENLVGLCKQTLTGVDLSSDVPVAEQLQNITDQTFQQLSSHYDVDLNCSANRIFPFVRQVLVESLNVHEDRQIDYADMIWQPLVQKMRIWRWPMLLVDEAQDLNRCQQELACRMAWRLVLCGDPKQAIYGFAGADGESMQRMWKRLDKTKQGVQHCKLTVTRRCGSAIVEEAKKLVPEFDAHESNSEGEVTYGVWKGDRYHSEVQDGDMILCRTNAPLVQQCFRFLAKGRKAKIQGRDLGDQLINLVERMQAKNTVELVEVLGKWMDMEIQKENAKKNPSENRIINIKDRHDCLVTFTEGLETVKAVIDRINDIFTDERTRGILLTSIHKAKGLEANNVFFLVPEEAPCPHPMAKTDHAYEQELNLKYVAITRAIKKLTYVG